MPGVPRTNRCSGCKRRKIKCDENWPTCGGCARAKTTCSGPPNPHTFVTHFPPNQAVEGIPERSGITNRHGSLMLLQSQRLHGSDSCIGTFRLYSSTLSPGSNLTTSADRIAARLAAMLTHDAPHDMMFQAGYLKYLPARISSSPALRDAVALMCSAYANFQRGLPANQVLNPTLYGKALRSLGRAIDNRTCITAETVAATTIMERVEILFDAGRPFHRARHARGIDTLTRQRGPPKLDDEFDVQLALENHAALICQWTVDGGDNFFLRSPWKEFVDRATVSAGGVSEKRKDIYAIGRYYVYWPCLLQEFKRLNSERDEPTRMAQAERLGRIVSALDFDVRAKGDCLLEKAYNLGNIKERPDPQTPIGARYDIVCLDSLQLLVSYAMWAAICNRMLHHLRMVQGLAPSPSLDKDHRNFCRQIWMCIPYIQELGGTTSVLFVAPLYLSYEGATEELEKEYLFDYIVEVTRKRGRLMENLQDLERLVLNTARAMAAREELAH
ncbi:unnamed protein product [Clonostachys byssicola]|uniref:Zn(2)-C6 fungal-type domain-containing protein n=1 Tax=Clonostachys byssicola TaxID=160290 RepID=A0A9N9UUH2_9HYPO|nr:unnamed protein product [Clonostachys byssicola]